MKKIQILLVRMRVRMVTVLGRRKVERRERHHHRLSKSKQQRKR